MAIRKTPFGQRQKRIERLTGEVQRLRYDGEIQKNMIAALEESDRRKASKLVRLTVEFRKMQDEYDLLAERLEEENMDYAEKQGFFEDKRKDRYDALGKSLNSIAEKLSKEGRVCKLVEIKSGDVLKEEVNVKDVYLVYFFKGSTPANMWGYIHEFEEQILEEPHNRFIHKFGEHESLHNVKYGEVLDPIQFCHASTGHKGPDKFHNDYAFFDGAHYFVLYFENVNNIDIENIARSHLQRYGLGLQENKDLKCLDFRNICLENKMAQCLKLEKERVERIMQGNVR